MVAMAQRTNTVQAAGRDWEPLQSIPGRFAYYGNHEGWLQVLGQHRDSDCLDRSNYRVIAKDLQARFPETVTEERHGHFLVGWVDVLIVNPQDSAAVQAAGEWKDRLDDYPVANEEDFSVLEYEEGVCGYCGVTNGEPFTVCCSCGHEEGN